MSNASKKDQASKMEYVDKIDNNNVGRKKEKQPISNSVF
jgi:hypothetical protein